MIELSHADFYQLAGGLIVTVGLIIIGGVKFIHSMISDKVDGLKGEVVSLRKEISEHRQATDEGLRINAKESEARAASLWEAISRMKDDLHKEFIDVRDWGNERFMTRSEHENVCRIKRTE